MDPIPPSDLGRAGLVVAGKFRLDTLIGRGGMGSVWSATHTSLGHRLAIKLIAREYVRSPQALRRFDGEAKAAARLQSRHVVQVFDNGTLDDGTPFIAMELLTGQNVGERLARTGPLSLAETVEILGQCCKALGRAHASGIVHRDIKPDNIFLAREPDEEADVVKILDFGVAKMAIGFEEGAQVTGTGAIVGTPLYMSPEQIRGLREIDHRTDLYSLGIVAYTMLTGREAIGGDAFGDILVKVCTEPLPSLLAARPALPRSMEAWFQKACAREANDRYQSAQGFIDALRAASLPSMSRLAAAAPVRFGHADAIAATAPAPVGFGPTRRSEPAGSAAAPGQILVPVDKPSMPPEQSRVPNAPAVSQSAAAVSMTAAGLPRKRRGPAAIAGILAGVLSIAAVGALVLFVVVPLVHGSANAPTGGSGAAGSQASASTVAAPRASVAPPSSVVLSVAVKPPADSATAVPSAKPPLPEASASALAVASASAVVGSAGPTHPPVAPSASHAQPPPRTPIIVPRSLGY